MPLSIPLLDKILPDYAKRSLTDDFCNRAHYLFTTALLFFFAILIAGKQTFGEPIQCMTPGEYGGNWANYVNEYCFSTSTYIDKHGSYSENVDGMRTIGYYQWVPYVLLVMAASFYVPHAIWLNLRTKADVDFESAVKQSGAIRAKHELDKREIALRKLAAYLCEVNRLRQRHDRDVWGRGLGSTGSFVYVASKLLNLVNVAVQFFLIVTFVGEGQLLWGFRLVRDALHGIYWDHNGFFPRVAYCRFLELSSQAGNQSRLVQCVLMINMINEKIFLFIYFWFLLLFLVTLIDVCWSVAHFLLGVGQEKFGKRYLKMVDRLESEELKTEREVRKFIHDSLGRDGLLLFHFIDSLVGSMVAEEIACKFYVKMLTDPEGRLDAEELKDDKGDEDD